MPRRVTLAQQGKVSQVQVNLRVLIAPQGVCNPFLERQRVSNVCQVGSRPRLAANIAFLAQSATFKTAQEKPRAPLAWLVHSSQVLARPHASCAAQARRSPTLRPVHAMRAWPAKLRAKLVNRTARTASLDTSKQAVGKPRAFNAARGSSKRSQMPLDAKNVPAGTTKTSRPKPRVYRATTTARKACITMDVARRLPGNANHAK
jgi:hypothetical protein